MGAKMWNVVLDGQPYEIIVDHGYFSGRRRLYVNGSLVLDQRPGLIDTLRLWNTAIDVPLAVGGHAGKVRIDPTVDNMTYKKYLTIDGRDVDTGAAVEELPVTTTGSREGRWLAGYGGPVMQPFALAAIVLGQLGAQMHSQPALWIVGFAGAAVCWSANRIVGEDVWRKILLGSAVVIGLFVLIRT